MYIQGKGIEQNDKKGIDLLRKSAHSGHAKAQYYLASMYYLGIGGKRSFDVAFQWMKKSAEQGYVDAQYNLALMYKQKKNQGLADKWFLIAAESTHIDE